MGISSKYSAGAILHLGNLDNKFYEKMMKKKLIIGSKKRKPRKSHVFRFFTGPFSYHGFFVSPRNDVYCFGINVHFELGLGHQIDQLSPLLHPFFKKLKDTIYRISTSDVHTIYMTCSGRLFASGCDQGGKTALKKSGAEDYSEYPTEIDSTFSVNEIADIFTGDQTSFFVSITGNVYAVGYNTEGQLGLGDDENRSFPELVQLHDKIDSVTACDETTFFLSSSGRVYVTGSNEYYQAGISDPDSEENDEDILTPVLLNFQRNSSLSLSGQSERIVKVEPGAYHAFFLSEGGRLYCTGDNEFGQLGIGRSPEFVSCVTPWAVDLQSLSAKSILDVSSGGNHACVKLLSKTGTIQFYTFGENTFHQVSSEDLGDRREPVHVEQLDKCHIDQYQCASSQIYYFDSRRFVMYASGEGCNGSLFSGEKTKMSVNNFQIVGKQFMKSMRDEGLVYKEKNSRFSFMRKLFPIWTVFVLFFRRTCK